MSVCHGLIVCDCLCKPTDIVSWKLNEMKMVCLVRGVLLLLRCAGVAVQLGDRRHVAVLGGMAVWLGDRSHVAVWRCACKDACPHEKKWLL